MTEKEVKIKVLSYIADWHNKWGILFDVSSLWIHWNQYYNPGIERGENLEDEVVYQISETVLELIVDRILIPKIGYHGFSTKEFKIHDYQKLLHKKEQLMNS